MMNLIILLLCLLFVRLFIFLFLEYINISYLKRNSSNFTQAARGVMDSNTFLKSVDYTKAKSRFSCFSAIYEALILGLIITLGILPHIYDLLSNFFWPNYLGQSLTFIVTLFLISITNFPINLWETFKLEERFGFNNSTLKLWISDQIKGFLLSLIIGIPLLISLMWIVSSMGKSWWLWAFFLLWLFQVVMVILYPMFILPIFNKLEPLQEGELKDRLLSLGDRCGFTSKTILVMDGSKRSGHSNAFLQALVNFGKLFFTIP